MQFVATSPQAVFGVLVTTNQEMTLCPVACCQKNQRVVPQVTAVLSHVLADVSTRNVLDVTYCTRTDFVEEFLVDTIKRETFFQTPSLKKFHEVNNPWHASLISRIQVRSGRMKVIRRTDYAHKTAFMVESNS